MPSSDGDKRERATVATQGVQASQPARATATAGSRWYDVPHVAVMTGPYAVADERGSNMPVLQHRLHSSPGTGMALATA